MTARMLETVRSSLYAPLDVFEALELESPAWLRRLVVRLDGPIVNALLRSNGFHDGVSGS